MTSGETKYLHATRSQPHSAGQSAPAVVSDRAVTARDRKSGTL
ncbi:hypothetical protein Ae263Ps1_6201 [Pseudonocardia sp. Ae263_Ps1]|nr:hypothetical protein Ae263Ps1_6201 [Pseudonocardia sp. Ae263_Ps1]